MIPRLYIFMLHIASLILIPSYVKAMTDFEFRQWWSTYRYHASIPSTLREMEDYFIASEMLQHTSHFWNAFNQLNIQQITLYGYQNFKQTVTRNYFTWVISSDHSYFRNLKNLTPVWNINIPQEEMNKVHSLFTTQESKEYNITTSNYLNYFVSSNKECFINAIQEPLIGNPPYITYNNRRISQDIMNSLLEFIPISEHCPLNKISTIVEVGAGSGRTAYCFLSLIPNIKYIIVDFPPALYVSQQYLTDVFPEKKVMAFKHFSAFDEVAEEFDQADIVFIMPNQISLLPDKSANLFLAIDCLHEMRPSEIDFYFGQAQRLSSYFYFKCWQNTVVPYEYFAYNIDSYPIYPTWTQLFKEPCVAPSDFFHAFYQITEK